MCVWGGELTHDNQAGRKFECACNVLSAAFMIICLLVLTQHKNERETLKIESHKPYAISALEHGKQINVREKAVNKFDPEHNHTPCYTSVESLCLSPIQVLFQIQNMHLNHILIYSLLMH